MQISLLNATFWQKKLCEYCIGRKLWLSAEHIPGCESITADLVPRTFNENTEWSVSSSIFQNIMRYFSFVPEVGLFAIYANKQVGKYLSWYPEPASYAIDAIKLDWQGLQFYHFPPFSLIGVSISKLIWERALGIMIIPYCRTQNWFPLITPVSSRLPSGNRIHLVVLDSSNRPKSQTSFGTKTQIDGSSLTRYTVKISNASDESRIVIRLMVKHEQTALWRDFGKMETTLYSAERQSLCCRREHDSRIRSW